MLFRSEGNAGKIRVVNAGNPNRELLHGLGLDRLFSVENGNNSESSRSLPSTEELQPLPDTDITSLNKPLDREATADLMLEAHTNLIRADSQNAEKFREVTQCLREKIERRHAEMKK